MDDYKRAGGLRKKRMGLRKVRIRTNYFGGKKRVWMAVDNSRAKRPKSWAGLIRNKNSVGLSTRRQH